MANCCSYGMRIKGDKVNVEEFIRAMKWEGEYEEQGTGRVYDCDVYDEYELDGKYVVQCNGSCAWSVLSAMRQFDNENNIEQLSARLNLIIEAFSEECGLQFMEHFAIDSGAVLCDDCIDWTCYCIDEIEEEDFWEEYGEDLIKAGITKDNYMDYVIDDRISIGGIEWDYEFI